MTLRVALAAAFLVWADVALADDCPAAPDPVISLGFDSRYVPEDASRSEIDPEARDKAMAAIAPVDQFLRDLVRAANRVVAGRPGTDAGCLLMQLAAWAHADALSDLGSDTARLTIGARLAGFALVLRQITPATTRPDDAEIVRAWLVTRITEQITFWEDMAPPGARQGNLRAWAALAGAAVASLTDDAAIRDWSAASLSDVLCTVAPDGSIPQEMTRGRLALHYQLHAIGPLVTGVLILGEQGVMLHDTCDGALARAVLFAVDDLETGAATQAITGEIQSFFDGSAELRGFHLAWIEAYLRLPEMPGRDALDLLAEEWRPLNYSKLGGNQTLLWGETAPTSSTPTDG
jgi:poly(beta-D-mannuronate) lyase